MTHHPKFGTVRLEDMRLFAAVAEARSFTEAARRLQVPKQTLSRRVAELERALGVRLMNRTSRRVQLTDAGAAYAERSAEVARLADEANQAVRDALEVPTGTLRVTADPVFGEAFLTPLVLAYAKAWPEVRVDVVLTRRRVELLEEGFDVAFRVGQIDDPVLSGVRLGAARVRYCASPGYVKARGAPARPDQLEGHSCIIVSSDRAGARWPFPSEKGVRLLPVNARLMTSSFEMAHEAALNGLGIAIFPEFACAHDLERGRLVPVLGKPVDVGSVWLLHLARRFLPARVRAFVDLAKDRLLIRP